MDRKSHKSIILSYTKFKTIFYFKINNMKNSKLVLLASLAIVFIAQSCSNDPSITGSVNLSMKSSGSTTINTGGRLAGTVEITEFKISIRDVAFKNEDDANPQFDTMEVRFRGPYQLDLLNGGDALTETLGNAIIPNGLYKEIRFKFHKDEDLTPTDNLFDRSLFAAGTIDGVPFELSHDTSENFDVGRTTGVIVQDNEVNLTVEFSIDQFLSSLNPIDLSTAVDGNQDGLIEIGTNDPDGNKDLADLLKDNIKEAADLIKL